MLDGDRKDGSGADLLVFDVRESGMRVCQSRIDGFLMLNVPA